MNPLLALPLFFPAAALVALLIAWAAFRQFHQPRRADLQDLEVLFYSAPEPYAWVDRVLGHVDFDFLAATRGGEEFIPRLRKQRVRAMRGVLAQMEEEFESLFAIGMLFAAAPTAQAESFARQLSAQRRRFYLTYYRLKFRTAVNSFVLRPFEVAPLGSEIRTLRRQADRILHAMTPADLGALRTVLRSN